MAVADEDGGIFGLSADHPPAEAIGEECRRSLRVGDGQTYMVDAIGQSVHEQALLFVDGTCWMSLALANLAAAPIGDRSRRPGLTGRSRVAI
jgi:hypothetical protein